MPQLPTASLWGQEQEGLTVKIHYKYTIDRIIIIIIILIIILIVIKKVVVVVIIIVIIIIKL